MSLKRMPIDMIADRTTGKKLDEILKETDTDINGLTTQMADITPQLKSMGAKLDGVTDDAPIINNYINQLPTSGKLRTIVLPDTTIAISNITITTPNVILKGGNNTVLKKLTSGSDFINVNADGVTIENITFDDNGIGSCYIVNANYNTNTLQKDVKLKGLKYTAKHVNSRGIIVGYYDGVSISECKLEHTIGAQSVYSFGIAVWSSKESGNVTITNMMTKNIHIYRNHVVGFNTGIKSWGTGVGASGNRQRVFINHNIVEKSLTFGIDGYHTPRSDISNNVVRNCGDIGIWSDSGGDYEYDTSDGTQGYGNRVLGNTVYKCRVGILTEEFRYGAISNNTIFQCTDYGLGLGGGTDSSSINNNTVFENGYGIYIDKNINPNTYYIFDLELNNNVVKRNKYHGYHIGGTKKSIKISGGFVTDNGTVNVGNASPSTNYAGIWIGKDGINADGSNVTHVRIHNVEISNGFDSGAGTTETGAQAYGVYCQQGAVNQIMITSCYFSGHTLNHISAPWMTSGVTIKDTSFLTTNIGNNVGNSLLFTSGNVGQLTDYKNGNNSFNLTGSWNGDHLIMNGNHLWVDSGKLYIKASAPTSATDGTVVGTQV